MSKRDISGQLQNFDEDLNEKIDDFQAEAQIKFAALTALVLGLLFCFLVLVTVVATVSSDHKGSSPAFSSTTGAQGESGLHSLYIPVAADTYLNKAVPSKNFGSEKTMRLGRSGNVGYYPLLRFVMPDLTGFTIQSVDLLLTPEGEWGEDSPAIKVLACSSEWDEQTVTMHSTLKKGAILGFLSAGQGYTGTQVRIPLDPNGFSTGHSVGIWLETSTSSSNKTFLTRETGKGAQLLLTVIGTRPPPAIPDAPSVSTPSEDGSGKPPATPAATVVHPPVEGQWKQIFYESFEEPDVPGDDERTNPAGWLVFGHPIHQRLADEDCGLFATPYGTQSMSCYAGTSVAAKCGHALTSRHILDEKLAAKTRYLLMFNVAAVSERPTAYYRVELLAIDDSLFPEEMPKDAFKDAEYGVEVLAAKFSKNDGSKDMSFSDYLVFEPDARHKNMIGKRLAIRLGMDYAFEAKGGHYRDKPIFDNVSLSVDKSGDDK